MDDLKKALGGFMLVLLKVPFRSVKGELYPCKPDIFAATYELA